MKAYFVSYSFQYNVILPKSGNWMGLLCILFFFMERLSAQTIAPTSYFSDTSNYKIELMAFNTAANNYHAVPYKNGVVFCSSKKESWGVVYESSTGKAFSDLFYTELKNSGDWTKPEIFSKSINSKLDEGPFCFNETGNIIYFTSNNERGGKQKKTGELRTLKIFKAELIDGLWTNFEPFIFNSDYFNVGHPALSADGKKLFFVSDMPGGLGGTDIYVTYLHHGQWSKPVNLGAEINTYGNELFPLIGHDGLLYFSSDGHEGMGKLDIFSARFIDSEWKNVRNMEAPLNSVADDFSYVPERNAVSGYFSSNRNHNGTDAIYKFQSLKTPCDSLTEINKCFTFYEEASIVKENLPLVYEWDLGDGTRHRGLEVNHCYAHEGDYKIFLNIIDTLTKNIYFNEASYVITIPPVTTPYMEIKNPPLTRKIIEFDGRKSRMGNYKINEFIWDFGDGTKSIGPRVSHIYSQKGKYQISLTAIGKDSMDIETEQCVYKILEVQDTLKHKPFSSPDSAKKVDQVAKTVYSAEIEEDLVFKVQVTSSDKPIEINSENFTGLNNVSEFYDKGIYGYTVGEGKSLEEMYPLYNDVKIKGYDDAQVRAFKNNKLISDIDTNKRLFSNGKSITQITGRVMTRFGDPLQAIIVIENLQTGKIISKFPNRAEEGKYSFDLDNGDIYGYYAEKENYYSISNFIDLRNEKRSLEIKKNIEMIELNDLYEENLSLRINNLFFGSKQFNISQESYPELNRLAALIKKYPGLRIEVGGHSDNMGSEDFNFLLSQKRAEAVKEYLKAAGCSEEKIISKGYGFTHPLVSNNTERGRYLNRRVEIRFIKD
jgi:outer membrane protein OmpA-like peptidoglycan-associated protein